MANLRRVFSPLSGSAFSMRVRIQEVSQNANPDKHQWFLRMKNLKKCTTVPLVPREHSRPRSRPEKTPVQSLSHRL